MSDDSIDIIVHGKLCPNWPSPQTTDEWLAAQLVKDSEEDGDWFLGDGSDVSHVSRCPFCQQAVFIFMDHGTIDFGIESTQEEEGTP